MLSSLLNFSFLDAFGAEDEKWGSVSPASASTSPMSASTGWRTPRLPSELGTDGGSKPGDFTPPRSGRRSSVFFRIPEDSKSRRVIGANQSDTLAKFGKAPSHRRRASVLLGSSPPTSGVSSEDTKIVASRPVDQDTVPEPGHPNVSRRDTKKRESWRKKRRGELLRGWDYPEVSSDPPQGPRSSRALSEGHR